MSKNEEKRSNELTRRDYFNAKNASHKIENGLELQLVAVGSYEDTDKDGKPVNVSVLKTESGEIYTTISATIADSLDDLSDIISDEGYINVKVITKKSAAGREFFQLEIA